MKISPSRLPNIDEVQIRIMGRWGKTVTVTDSSAQTIADLWRRLPYGEQSRCHIPTYELTFLAAGQVICSATVCWKCNNVHGHFNGQRFGFEFDGEAPVSQLLLAVVRKVNDCGDSNFE